MLDYVHFNHVQLSVSSETTRGVLRSGVGRGILSSTTVSNPRQQWIPDAWKDYYVRFGDGKNVSNMFRIIGNSENVIRFDTTGFPSGRTFDRSSMAHLPYQIMTAGGLPITYAQEKGRGYLVFPCDEKMTTPFRITLRSESPEPCRAVLSVAHAQQRSWIPLMTNDCAECIWVTRYINPDIIGTQLVLRFEILDNPSPIVYFHSFASVPALERVNAININAATSQQLQTRLGWSKQLASAVISSRPFQSFAQLRAVPGITDNILLKSIDRILFRSDNWSAAIECTCGDATTCRYAWFRRYPSLTSDIKGSFSKVNVVETQRVTAQPRFCQRVYEN